MPAPPPVRPIRRRLALLFMLVAGLAAGALAAGSWVVAREARLDDAADRSLDQTRFNLLLARDRLAGSSSPADLNALLASLRGRGDFESVALAGRTTVVSSPTVGRREVPLELRRLAADGEVGWQRVDVGGEPYLVAGARVPGTQAELYSFFAEGALHADLRDLARILAAGWAVVVVGAGLLGGVLARRALAPVAAASAGARAVAEELTGRRVEPRGDELTTWAASFADMAEALRDRIAELEAARAREVRFTADVAHELRTPLTALVAEAMLLAENAGTLAPEPRRLAELLAGDVDRLRRLVDDLLEISRLDAAAEPVRAEPVALAALVEALVEARGWGTAVAVTGDARVVSDRRRLERVLGNLVENALVHGGGAATVRIAAGADGVGVEVADDGPGIPPEVLPHVFERFAKGDPARAGEGTGLGLAIAREHARVLGGDIEARSDPGRGSRFTVLLPGVTEPLPAGDRAVAPAGHAGVVPDHGGDPR